MTAGKETHVRGLAARAGVPALALLAAAVVPGFRVRAVTRGEDLVAHYPGGFARWTVGGGFAARVGF